MESTIERVKRIARFYAESDKKERIRLGRVLAGEVKPDWIKSKWCN